MLQSAREMSSRFGRWAPEVEAAWDEARRLGCSRAIWLRLAQRSEGARPEDALAVYRQEVDTLLQVTDKRVYIEAVGLLRRMKALMAGLGRADEFADYASDVRVAKCDECRRVGARNPLEVNTSCSSGRFLRPEPYSFPLQAEDRPAGRRIRPIPGARASPHRGMCSLEAEDRQPGRPVVVTIACHASNDLPPSTREVKYAVVYERAVNNCAAYVPDLPGCVATGRTTVEGEQRIREAIRMHIEGLREKGEPVPEPET
jgi:predicted RNase H-like HicB family nuclease